MKDERIEVILYNGEPENSSYIKLTPEQLKFLEWLDNKGFLYCSGFDTDIQFEPI